MNQWLLPENAEDIFPKKAARYRIKKKTAYRSLS